MNYTYITRRETFCSAHKLWNPAWDVNKNEATFGGCANPNWHGHNYVLFITIKGFIHSETGFVMNLKDLKTLMKQKVLDLVDHKNLNMDVAFLQHIIPSTENFAKAIWEQLFEEIQKTGALLHCVKLVETENNYVEYYG